MAVIMTRRVLIVFGVVATICSAFLIACDFSSVNSDLTLTQTIHVGAIQMRLPDSARLNTALPSEFPGPSQSGTFIVRGAPNVEVRFASKSGTGEDRHIPGWAKDGRCSHAHPLDVVGAEAAFICEHTSMNNEETWVELQLDLPGGGQVSIIGVASADYSPRTAAGREFLRSVFATVEVVTEFGPLTQIVKAGPIRMFIPENVTWRFDAQTGTHYIADGPVGTPNLWVFLIPMIIQDDSPLCEPLDAPGDIRAAICLDGGRSHRSNLPYVLVVADSGSSYGHSWLLQGESIMSKDFVSAVFDSLYVVSKNIP